MGLGPWSQIIRSNAKATNARGLYAGEFRDKMIGMGFPEEKTDAIMALLDARAGVLGMPTDDYIANRILDITPGAARDYFDNEESYIDNTLNRFKRANLLSGADALAIIGAEKPAYLQDVEDFISGQFAKYKAGSFQPRDVAKALGMTIASQGTAGMILGNLVEKLGDSSEFGRWLTHGDQAELVMTATDQRGMSGNIRPEEAAACWFLSPAGKKALDETDRGEFRPESWTELSAIRAAMGDDRFKTMAAFTPTARNKSGNPTGNYGFDMIPAITSEINAAGKQGDTGEKLSRIVSKFRGVGEAKNGFIMHFFGIPGRATFDAVEINFWLTGVGETRHIPAAYREKWEGLSDEIRSRLNRKSVQLTQELKDVISNTRVSSVVAQRLQSRLDGLRRQLAPDNPGLTSHILHHWIWDQAKGTMTSHAGMYQAMRLAQRDKDNFKGMVEFDRENQAVIRVFESGDISTVCHELGHVFRRDMTGAEHEAARQWLGLKPGEGWDEAAEEKFARGFEAYLTAGVAPKGASAVLVGVFEKFKKWLSVIYKSFLASYTKSNDLGGARKVFDAMLDPGAHGRLERAHARSRMSLEEELSWIESVAGRLPVTRLASTIKAGSAQDCGHDSGTGHFSRGNTCGGRRGQGGSSMANYRHNLINDLKERYASRVNTKSWPNAKSWYDQVADTARDPENIDLLKNMRQQMEAGNFTEGVDEHDREDAIDFLGSVIRNMEPAAPAQRPSPQEFDDWMDELDGEAKKLGIDTASTPEPSSKSPSPEEFDDWLNELEEDYGKMATIDEDAVFAKALAAHKPEPAPSTGADWTADDLDPGDGGPAFHFKNPAAVRDAADKARQILGRDVKPRELAAMTGLSAILKHFPDNDIEIRVGANNRGPVLTLSSSGDGFVMTRTLALGDDGKPMIHNDLFEIDRDDRGEGLGINIFSSQVEESIKAGIARIECYAAGDYSTMQEGGFIGYYVWPRFGYDQRQRPGDFEPEAISDLEGILGRKLGRRTFRVAELMATEEGRDWWKRNGSDLDEATFDLSKGSLSREVLSLYRKEKGLDPADGPHRFQHRDDYRMSNHPGNPGRRKGDQAPNLTPEDDAALNRAWAKLKGRIDKEVQREQAEHDAAESRDRRRGQ